MATCPGQGDQVKGQGSTGGHIRDGAKEQGATQQGQGSNDRVKAISSVMVYSMTMEGLVFKSLLACLN